WRWPADGSSLPEGRGPGPCPDAGRPDGPLGHVRLLRHPHRLGAGDPRHSVLGVARGGPGRAARALPPGRAEGPGWLRTAVPRGAGRDPRRGGERGGAPLTTGPRGSPGRIAPRLAGVPRGARVAPRAPRPGLEDGDPVEHRPRSARRVDPAARRRTRRLGDGPR